MKKYLFALVAFASGGAAGQTADLPLAIPLEKRVEVLEDTVATLKKQVESCTCAVQSKSKFGTTPPTAKMVKAGLSWQDVKNFAGHVVNLLEKDGAAAVNVARNSLKLIEAVTELDLTGIQNALRDGKSDLLKIIADIREEFGLSVPAGQVFVPPSTAPTITYGTPVVTYGVPTVTYGTPTIVGQSATFGDVGGCPGGVCPVPGRSNSGPVRRLFGR